MIKLNLKTNRKFQRGFDEIQAYKERVKLAFEENEAFMISTMKAFGFTSKENNVGKQLMNIEGSGFQQTKGRGFNDKVSFTTDANGRPQLVVQQSCESLPLKKVWLIKFLREKAIEMGMIKEKIK